MLALSPSASSSVESRCVPCAARRKRNGMPLPEWIELDGDIPRVAS